MKQSHTIKKLDTPNYGRFEALYRAFYSKNLYQDIGNRWRGFGCIYLLLVLSIAYLPIGCKITFKLHNYFNNELLYPLKHMPSLYLQNGNISLDNGQIYRIKNSKNQLVGLIDTSSNANFFPKQYPNLNLYITKHTIFFKAPEPPMFYGMKHVFFDDSIKTYTFSKDSTEIIQAESFSKTFNIFNTSVYFLELMIYPMLLGVIYGLYVVYIFIFGFLGKMFALTILRMQLSYKQCIRILAVSSTPHIFFTAMLVYFNAQFSLSGIVIMGLAIFYFIFAALTIKSSQTKMAIQ